jgi:thiamine transport system permease protein
MALALALRRDAASDIIGALPLAASSLVVGTGLFLMIFSFAAPSAMALPVTILANATLALPFVLRIIGPPLRSEVANYGRLSESLGLVGWQAVRIVILPRIMGPLRFALGLAAALSMGDLGVIALFATENQETLPLAMFRLMGAYRMDDAASAGLLLVVLSFGLFWICDQGGRHAAPE